jgi:hypothetical protein
MNIALDIDGTITKNPGFFSLLSQSVRRAGGRVYIVTSRGNADGVEEQTRQELASYGLEFDALFIIADSGGQEQIACPHENLDWYQKYLWQKVRVCLDHNVHIVFDDDPKVVSLFEKYAPDIQVFQVR